MGYVERTRKHWRALKRQGFLSHHAVVVSMHARSTGDLCGAVQMGEEKRAGKPRQQERRVGDMAKSEQDTLRNSKQADQTCLKY